MGVQDAVPSGYRRALSECPVCHGSEYVVAVPAIFESAAATEETLAHAQHVLHDDDSSTALKSAARRRIAASASAPAVVRSRLLAPAPQSSAGCFLAGGIFFAFPAVVARFIDTASQDWATTTDDADRLFETVANVAAGLVALCLIGLVTTFVRRRRVRSGRPAADVVWRRGWYCTRCAVVHFTPGDEPDGVTPGQALDPDAFRRLVWTAGGYGSRFRPRG